jgi:hypothetical protein
MADKPAVALQLRLRQDFAGHDGGQAKGSADAHEFDCRFFLFQLPVELNRQALRG